MISFAREKIVQNMMRIVREKIVILVRSHLRRRRIVGGQPHRRKMYHFECYGVRYGEF